MRAWKYTWTLVRYRPGLFAANCVLWGLWHNVPVLTGIIAKAFFDALSGQSEAGYNVWTLVAFLAIAGVARLAIFAGGVRTFIRLWYYLEALLRKNLLNWALTGPGSHPLTESPSQSMTRSDDAA